jgi:hypothetical protein
MLMKIEIHTDNNVDSGDALVLLVEDEVGAALAHFGDRITRVDVHVGDESAGKISDDDMRCLIEAFPAGHEPVSVTHHAATAHQALSGASRKMHRLLEGMFGKIDDRRTGRATIRGTRSD